MFHDGDDDGVSHRVIGLVVGTRKLVVAGSAHEKCCFKGGYEAGGPDAFVVEKEELSTAAAFGGAKTAGYVVEAKFEDLLAMAGAAVAREGGAIVSWQSVD